MTSQKEWDPLVKEVREIRRTVEDLTSSNHPNIRRIIKELDNIWWEEVNRILETSSRTDSQQLPMQPRERLLVDAGLLDPRLAGGNDALRAEIRREFTSQGSDSHFTFSEWLEKHYRTNMLYGQMRVSSFENERRKKESALALHTRKKIYDKIAPLFNDLPGFPKNAVRLLLSGRLDHTIDTLRADPDEDKTKNRAGQVNQLVQIRDRMLSIARSRAQADSEHAFLDAISRVERQTRKQPPPPSAPDLPESADIETRTEYIRRELRLVRSLLRLGVPGAGIGRTHSVLLTDRRRVTKTDLVPAVQLVETCDPYLPGPPSIVIAPYVGVGFYEWDRDTIFVPLLPTQPVEEAIVNALAAYRILLDGLQGKGSLKKEFEKEFKCRNFREEFTRDYRNWILGVGRGFRGALPPERFEFFRRRIGPSMNLLYAPADILRLSSEACRATIQELEVRIKDGLANGSDYFRLATCNIRQGNSTEAYRQLVEAVRLNPTSGRLLCSMGHLAAQLDSPDQARTFYNDAVRLSPNTLWGVFAADALLKL